MVRDGISERTVWRAEAPHERVFLGVGAQCIDLFIQMLSLSTYSVRGAVLGARTQLERGRHVPCLASHIVMWW